MRGTFCKFTVLLACAGAGLAGCNRSAVRDKQIPDPLVMTKRPVEGKSHPTELAKTARADYPAPPAYPGSGNEITTVSNPPGARLTGMRPIEGER